jgi:hypothetical protein
MIVEQWAKIGVQSLKYSWTLKISLEQKNFHSVDHVPRPIPNNITIVNVIIDYPFVHKFVKQGIIYHIVGHSCTPSTWKTCTHKTAWKWNYYVVVV